MQAPNRIEVYNGYDRDAFTYYPVLIVGAGESGIAMGCQLKRKLGFDQFRIFDRQSGMGGTWWINRYPGIGCDVPSPFYSFSWDPFYTAPKLYPDGASIVKYLHRVAAKYEIQDKVQLDTDVTECRWSEAEQLWTVKLSYMVPGTGDLSTHDRFERIAEQGERSVYLRHEIVKAKIVISCVGGLVEPKAWPENIPGLNDFKGEVFHAARWNHDVDLTDKDVVVVGTGCSSAQIVPTILKAPYKPKSVTQLMKTPPWVCPKAQEPGGKKAYAKNAPRILSTVPFLGWMLRQSLAAGAELAWFSLFPNTAYAAKGRKEAEKEMVERMKKMAPAKYHELLTPNYSIGCKRRIFDEDWYPAMYNDNYRLTAKKLTNLTPTGIQVGPEKWYPPGEKDDAAPEEIKADVVVLANGYATTTWLHPLEIRGKHGKTMHEVWKGRGGPQGYLGTAMDGFPNFFMVFGPNIATGHTSVIMQSENGILYILKMIAPLLKGDARAVEVKRDAEIAYTMQAQRELKDTVFGSGGCASWYVDPQTGWNTSMYPRSQIDYWWRCKFPKWSHWDYTYTQRGQAKKVLSRTLRISTLTAALVGEYWARRQGTTLNTILLQYVRMLLVIVLYRARRGLGKLAALV